MCNKNKNIYIYISTLVQCFTIYKLNFHDNFSPRYNLLPPYTENDYSILLIPTV